MSSWWLSPAQPGWIGRTPVVTALALPALLAASPGWAQCSTNTAMTGDTVTCAGSDTQGVNGINSASVILTNTGTIKAAAPAVWLGASATVTNNGTVESTTAPDKSSSFTLAVGPGSTVTNNDTISARSADSALFLNGNSSSATPFIVTNNGSVVANNEDGKPGAKPSGIGAGGNNSTKSTIINNGTITGLLRGISLRGDVITITNNGTITGNGMTGNDITGKPEMSSDGAGVLLVGKNNRVENNGTIDGKNGIGVHFKDSEGGNTLQIGTGSVLNGKALATGPGNTLVLSGTGADTLNVSDVGPLSSSPLTSGTKYQGFTLFEKAGAGTWTLTGTDTVRGAWTISGGTLVATTDSLKGTVTNNAALVFAQTIDGTYDSAISGTGTLTKSGSGRVTLNGVNTYTGLTTISGGTLMIGDADHPGARVAGAVTVGSAGTLSGHGGIGGSVTSDGTVSPGGSIGTLSVGGAYTQRAGGTFAVEVTELVLPSLVPLPLASLLQVGGAASLTGNLAVTRTPGIYFVGSRFIILTAGGGVTGTFAQTSGTEISVFTFLSPVYEPNRVLLEVVPRPATFSSVVTDPEQRIAAAVLDALARAAPPTLANAGNPLARDVAALQSISTVPQLERVIDQLFGSAEIYGGLASAAMRQSYIVATTTHEQMRRARAADGGIVLAEGAGPGQIQLAARDGGTGAGSGSAPVGAWISGYGEFGKVGGAATAHTVSFSTGGMLMGGDLRVSPDLYVGAFGGYGSSGLGLQRLDTSGTIDSYTFGSYGSWSAGRLYVDGLAGYIYNEETARRALPIPFLPTRTAFGDTHAHQFLGSLEVGYRITPPDYQVLDVTPFLGLQGTTLTQAPLGERSGEELGLAINGLDAGSARGLLGLRFDRGIDLGEGAAATASLKFGWAREIIDTQRIVTGSLPVLPGSSIALQAARPRRDSALAGAGIATRVDGGLSAFVRYDGDLNGVDDSHAVIAGVRVTW